MPGAEESPPTPEVAMDAWYKLREGRADSPHIYVWFPTALPYGRLETRHVDGDAHGKEYLPEGRTTAHVVISGVDFGGYLDDLELLFAAVSEQIQRLRWVESELRKES